MHYFPNVKQQTEKLNLDCHVNVRVRFFFLVLACVVNLGVVLLVVAGRGVRVWRDLGPVKTEEKNVTMFVIVMDTHKG